MATTNQSHELDDASGLKLSPHTEEACESIRQQLKRVVDSTPFKSSKRYPALLSYVVEKTLEGRSDDLKERTLGSEVFHRDPQYDTNADPVVRITAGEVRKRLAQYYYEPTHKDEIRIELPPGSYVPEFYRPRGSGHSSFAGDGNGGTAVPALDNLASPLVVASPDAISVPAKPPGGISRFLLPLACLALGVLLGGITIHRHDAPAPPSAPTAIDKFWRPLINTPGTVWVCVGGGESWRLEGDPHTTPSRVSPATASEAETAFPKTTLIDAIALGRVSGLLQSRGKTYEAHGETDTTFADLARGPSVLIGAYNNDWTIHLLDQLRFHFAQDPKTKEQWIADRQKPDARIGLRALRSASPDTEEAYGVVSRVREPETGQVVVALAGVSPNGTRAAVTFVSDPEYLDDLAKHAPPKWADANLQIVIAATVVHGSQGPPRVISSYTW